MSTALNSDLCRISVEGPDKRVDLAVPATTTVAALLPVLLHHTAEWANVDLDKPEECWALQRMGGVPFDPNGTPESLDWLEGERLYLRPVEDQLPEMHFDDISEGIAETVNERGDRWQPEYRRPLFVGLSAVVIVLFVHVLLNPELSGVRPGLGGTLAVAVGLTSVLFARSPRDRALSILFGLAAAGLAAVTTMDLADGQAGRIVLTETSLAAGSGAAALLGVILVVVQRFWVPHLAYPVFLTVTGLGLTVDGVIVIQALAGTNASATAALSVTVLFGILIFSPNLVLRAARLRGPQLPKTGSELQFDIEPYQAEEMQRRASKSQNYLSVLIICISGALPVLFWEILSAGGWASWTLVGVVVAGVLLRARVPVNVWQRVALTACGTIGVIMLLTRASRTASTDWLLLILLILAVLLLVTVMAAMRPWPRRLLPIWEFTATVFDVLVGLVVLPIALQLMHVYSWARGLFG